MSRRPMAGAGPDPREILAALQHAVALHQQGDLPAAARIYDQVIRLVPDQFDALHLRGVVALQMGRAGEGVPLIARALKARPDAAAAHNNLGNGLRELKRFNEALASFDRALALHPGYAAAEANRGATLRQLGRLEEALAACDRAVALDPDLPDAQCNRGNALLALRQPAEALACYDRALALAPRLGEALANRALALRDLGRLEEALAACDAALAVQPERAATLAGRGHVLLELRRHAEAIASYERAMALDRDPAFLPGAVLQAKLAGSDWDGIEVAEEALARAIRRRQKAASPFDTLALTGARDLQAQAARLWVETQLAVSPPPRLPAAPVRPEGRIRLGYVSMDFGEHAVSYLMAEVFERHDRARFETFALSLGARRADSEIARRVRGAFEHFLEVQDLSDAAIAALARERGIDLAIDLAGYTRGARPEVFARRAAPVQAAYLGYLGTTGAGYMDYLLADAVLVPDAHRRDYAEKILRLPAYQANDTSRPRLERLPSRAEAGLPAEGFVFCCLNATYKLTPAVFGGWMRLLGQVPGAVLWLLEETAEASARLRQAAATRGIDPDRLRFAPRAPRAEYLARYRLADLFLDTLPYNAGATASDALWEGLPVLTRLGDTFAGRIGASLLHAIGLPELVAETAEAYEAMAVALARDPARLAALRDRLAANRLTQPLFDAARHTRSLESAYQAMVDRHRAGLPPDHFDIAP